MTLLFVRHGQSEGNAQRLMQGWLDLDLTPTGREQAVAVAKRLASVGASRLYASPLKRARATADAIAAHTGLEVSELPDLREYGYGEAQGLSWSTAVERWGLTAEAWGTGIVPGEEGGQVFRDRVTACFDELIVRHAEDVAIVVSHGGVLTSLIAHVLGLSWRDFVPVAGVNCGITTFEWDRGAPVLAGLNDDCHLRPA